MKTIARNQRGFTLAELMVAILIFGMITALSLPGYNRFLHNWKLKAEADQFASALRTARSDAVMKNLTTVFTFDTNARTYSYFEDLDHDGARDNNEYQSATYRLVPQVVFSAHTLAGTSVSFGPLGSTAANGSVTLRNSEDHIRTIRIYGGTGNITVE